MYENNIDFNKNRISNYASECSLDINWKNWIVQMNILFKFYTNFGYDFYFNHFLLDNFSWTYISEKIRLDGNLSIEIEFPSTNVFIMEYWIILNLQLTCNHLYKYSVE